MKRTKLSVTVLSLLLILSLIFLTSAAELQAEERVLRIRAQGGADVNSVDPAHLYGSEDVNLDLAIFHKLLRFEKGSFELENDAVEWIDFSDDYREIEFKLKEGIQFHHGYGEMTTEDVKFSFERIVDPETGSWYADDWQGLKEVEIIDRYQGRIIMEEPFAALLTSTIPWNPGSIISKEAYQDRGEEFETNPVGSGPYYWEEWTPGEKIVLKRFEDYIGEAPDFDRIEIYSIGEIRVADMLFERGDLDETDIPFDSVAKYEDMDDVNLEVLTNLAYVWLGFNHSEPPFDDVLVREAVRSAVNVEEILQGVYDGVPEVARTILHPDILGYWEDAPEPEVDLEGARELLAEAGYPDGFDTTIYVDPTTEYQEMAVIVSAYLEQIGINAEVEIFSEGAGVDLLGVEAPPGMHIYGFSMTTDPNYWFYWFSEAQIGSWNFLHWSNPEYEELMGEAVSVMDQEERAEKYVRMQEIMHEDVAAIWLTHGSSPRVAREHVKPSYVGQFSQYMFFENLE